MSTLSAKEYKCFEDIKRIRPDGSEYWAARELAPVLDYAKWENFYKVIKRAMIACENSGRSTLECFPEVRKTSPMPNGGVKDILDYELSRYACYLIVQNGDPRKEVIALGQTYFAIQTYRQEVADRFNQLDEDSRRLVVRGDIKQWNQLLAETARNAGVITAEEFAIFQNAGYMGLYNLIPCCSICNSLKQDADTYTEPFIYPYEDSYGERVTFVANGVDAESVESWLGAAAGYQIKIEYSEEIDRGLKEKISRAAETLKLEELYSKHGDYVKDILRTAYIYDDTYFGGLVTQYPDLFNDKHEAKNFVFFNYLEEESWGKRVLAKLTHDIVSSVE